MSFPPRHSPPAPRQPAARFDRPAARRHTHKREPRSRRSAAFRGASRGKGLGARGGAQEARVNSGRGDL